MPVRADSEVEQCLVCSTLHYCLSITNFPFTYTKFLFSFANNNKIKTAESNSEDIGPSVVVVGGSSSPPSDGFAHHHHQSAHEHPDPSLPVQAIQQTDKRLRFPRFLRRTHSASASTEAPPYALFLRTKRVSFALSWELSCRELDSRSLDVSGVLLLTTNRRNRKNNTLSLLFCFHPDLSSVLGVAYGWVEGLRLSKQIDCQISIRCASDCVPLYSESAKLYEKPCFVDVNGGTQTRRLYLDCRMQSSAEFMPDVLFNAIIPPRAYILTQ